MSSREIVLRNIRQAQPEPTGLPSTYEAPSHNINVLEQFTQVLQSIGGQVTLAQDINEVISILNNGFPGGRIVTTLEHTPFELVRTADPHTYENVTLAVINSRIGVAENGAVWITEHDCPVRALPFIAAHLAVVIPATSIVHTLHQAYAKIDEQNYGFGVFIAGPSKTADIEQSLVLGAHGSRSMRVFILH